MLQGRGIERERFPAPPVTAEERQEILELSARLVSVNAVVLALRGRGRPRSTSTVYKVLKEASSTPPQ